MAHLSPQSIPKSGDIVLRQVPATSARCTLSTSEEAPQIACASFDEAMARADRFAQFRHVDVWQTDDRGCTRLIECRAARSACTPMTEPADGRPVLAPELRSVPEEVLHRVRGEFLEMPGLRLTEAQARRLWGLDATMCSAVLSALIDAEFLFCTRDGSFMRIEHAAPVKAMLTSRPERIPAA